MKRNVFILSLFVIIIASYLFMNISPAFVDNASTSYKSSSADDDIDHTQSEESYNVELLQETEDDLVFGDPHAPVKIFEYFSFSCGHCNELEKIIHKLRHKYVQKGKLFLVQRSVPFHSADVLASTLVKCINLHNINIDKDDEGRIDSSDISEKCILDHCLSSSDNNNYIDESCINNKCLTRDLQIRLRKAILDRQNHWVHPREFANRLSDIAMNAGMSASAIAQCKNDPKIKESVLAIYKMAAESGIDAVPCFFINGRKFEGLQSLDFFKKEIEAEMEKSKRAANK